MPGYYLSMHSYACVSDGHLIFLDAKRGTYSGLTPAEAHQALPLLSDATICPLQGKADPDKALPVIQKLISEGLITSNPARGKPLSSLEALRATKETIGSRTFAKPRVSALDVLRFGRALIWGVLIWKLLPFRCIHWLRQVRLHRSPAATADCPEEQLNALVDLFFHLAPFFYKQADRCFLNSLVLTEFLRSYGIGARWIFGVSAAPFSAHCWTQVGDTVVADSLFRIWRLTPILAI